MHESFEFCTVKHVNRDFNVVAHELAQLDGERNHHACGMGFPPLLCLC